MSELHEETSGNGAAAPQGSAPAETKNERFRRLAPGRVQRSLDALEQVARLAAPQNEYSEEESGRILDALRGKMSDLESRLMRRPGNKAAAFSFD